MASSAAPRWRCGATTTFTSPRSPSELRGRPRLLLEVFNRCVVGAVGLAMAVFGWQNFLQGFGSFRMPSMTPIAYLYWPIPVCGALVALFSLEQIVNGLRHGFAATAAPRRLPEAAI